MYTYDNKGKDEFPQKRVYCSQINNSFDGRCKNAFPLINSNSIWKLHTLKQNNVNK